MSNRRLLCSTKAALVLSLLGCLVGTQAGATTIATPIGTGTISTGTSNSATTTGAVASGGTLALVTYTTGTNNTPSAGGLTCTAGGADLISSARQYTYYCPAPSGLASGTVVSQTSGISGPSIIFAYALPPAVTTFDLGDTNDSVGGSTNPNFTTPVPNYTPEYMIVGVYFNGSTTYTADANDTPLDNVTVGAVNLYAEERLVSPSTSAIAYSASLGASRPWMATWTTFQYTPATTSTCNGGRRLRGTGSC